MRRHLTYANVMSTIAVFGILAGGYAVAAGGGDGSVRSRSIEEPGPDFETILRVPDLGAVQAACTGGSETQVAWKSIDRPTRVSVELNSGSISFQQQRGSRSAYEIGLGGIGTKVEFHVAPRLGADGPQTVVSVFGNGFSDPCADQISAVAVSTSK